MPEEFARLCIDAGCPPGGRILDPFLGSGTTGVVAEERGCDFFGIELNPEYARHATERILAARVKRLEAGNRSSLAKDGSVLVPSDDGGVIVGDELDGTNLDTVLAMSEELAVSVTTPAGAAIRLPDIHIDCSEDEYVEVDG